MAVQSCSAGEPMRLLTACDQMLEWSTQVSGGSTTAGSDGLKDFSRQQTDMSAYSDLGFAGMEDFKSGDLGVKPISLSWSGSPIQPPPGFEHEAPLSGGLLQAFDPSAANPALMQDDSVEDISGKIQELQHKLELLKLQQEEQVQLGQLRKLREQLRQQQQAVFKQRPHLMQPEASEDWMPQQIALAPPMPATIPMPATAPTDDINWEGVVTVMMRNLPNKYTQQKLKVEIDEAGFAGAYDFLYVPMDKQFGANKGYAFINFLESRHVHTLRTRFEGRCMSSYKSGKIVQISPASLQGFEANYNHFSNSSVIRGDPKNRPLFIRKPPKGKCLATEPMQLPPPPPAEPYPSSGVQGGTPNFLSGCSQAAAPAQPGQNMTRKFCTSCGARLTMSAARFCTSCGDRIQ